MAPFWEPGTQYNLGDIVVYKDVLYEIIQPHRSQSDWTPPVTPALWGRVRGGGGGHHHHREEQWGADCRPLPGGQQRQEVVEKVTYQDSSYQTSYQSPAQEREEKSWFGEHKKELEIGAGLAGLSLAGAGAYAYKQHEKKVEERQELEKAAYQSYQGSYQSPAAPPQEHSWVSDHKKELIGAGAIAAAGAGVYAYKHHEKKAEEESYHSPAAPPQESSWISDHKKELIGAGAIAAAGAGIYAYKHHDKKAEEESYRTSAPPEEKSWVSEHKKELIGAGAIAAAGAGIYAYKHHEKKEEEDSYQSSSVPPQENSWISDHKKELIGAGAIAAAGAGIHAYKHHEKKAEEESYNSSAVPPQENSWVSDHKKELIGAGAIAAAGAGIYAYKQHEKKVEEESHQSPAVPPQENSWISDHKKELIGAGAVAAVGAGIYAYKHHEKKTEEESYQGSVAPPEEKGWISEHKGLIGAGAVAAVGAGIYAYKQHEKKVEEEQARAWSASHWIQDAQTRTQQWRAGSYNAPVAWIWNEGQSIPRDAIQGGEERGEVLYICRVYHESGLLIGKASRVFKKGAVIGFKKEEIHVDKYEILVGDARAVRWVPWTGRLKVGSLGARPVEGGREPDGTPIYIAQAPHRGAVHPGKACETYGDGCYIPYDNSEKQVKEYAVLCYA